MATALAAYNTSYLARVPYLTNAEYQNAPTAMATNKLVPGGDANAQVTELANVIARASGIADGMVYGAEGTLCATVNTEVRRQRADRDGYWTVVPNFWPLLEVQTFLVGSTMADLVALDLSNTLVEEDSFTVFSGALSMVTTFGPLEFGSVRPGVRQVVQYTYVNGWPNQLLAAAASANATSIQVRNATGIYPGTSLTIYDGELTETVQVAQTYVEGATTLPLTAGLLNAHAIGVSVSALPPAVKQAAISLVSCLIKTRGSRAAVLPQTPGAQPDRAALSQAGALDDWKLAEKLLAPFRRVV